MSLPPPAHILCAFHFNNSIARMLSCATFSVESSASSARFPFHEGSPITQPGLESANASLNWSGQPIPPPLESRKLKCPLNIPPSTRKPTTKNEQASGSVEVIVSNFGTTRPVGF